MMMVLHSDANCFYASVEMVERPELRDTAMAVCGDTEQRHGIVLTASYPAKRRGVKTGMANWQAKQTCPGLIIVSPRYDLYLKYSHLLRRIYTRYSDRVESFGMDECWIELDCGENDAVETAELIRRQVREETGLTVSVGVSFTKALAKLGSDMKKPDAVTVLGRGTYREKTRDLPVSDLLYVGPATTRKLYKLGIMTIGQLAEMPEDVVVRLLGKNGYMIRSFARGEDGYPVADRDYRPEPKSIGHGATGVRDLENNGEIWRALYELAQDVGHRLIRHDLRTRVVFLYVKDNEMWMRSYRVPLTRPTQSPLIIAQAAYDRFRAAYDWARPVRALTVTACELKDANLPRQLDLFNDEMTADRREQADRAVDGLRCRYGMDIVRAGCMIGADLALATDECEKVTMPGMIYR
ncbi:MAG: DNA polymerase IV [Clostridia bacterium]|nr:DNA polymerase IV [Clostridia bacterium]